MRCACVAASAAHRPRQARRCFRDPLRALETAVPRWSAQQGATRRMIFTLMYVAALPHGSLAALLRKQRASAHLAEQLAQVGAGGARLGADEKLHGVQAVVERAQVGGGAQEPRAHLPPALRAARHTSHAARARHSSALASVQAGCGVHRGRSRAPRRGLLSVAVCHRLVGPCARTRVQRSTRVDARQTSKWGRDAAATSILEQRLRALTMPVTQRLSRLKRLKPSLGLPRPMRLPCRSSCMMDSADSVPASTTRHLHGTRVAMAAPHACVGVTTACGILGGADACPGSLGNVAAGHRTP